MFLFNTVITVETAKRAPAGPPPGRPRSRRARRAVPGSPLRRLGRLFIAVGILIVAFVLWELVGTNLLTSREQVALARELERKWDVVSQAEQVPDPGDAFGLLQIPKIDVDTAMVHGVAVEDLKKGPGHYPDSALPGYLGNLVIAGHRTTYGAPFYRLDELEAGDEIRVIDAQRRLHKYIVRESMVVEPDAVEVLAKTDDPRLTLITCTPRFSARQRLIVVADLVGTPVGLQTTSPLTSEVRAGR